ncbi:zinc-dependent alcohol dehydrogenase family protein [Streptomyces sp. DSM 44917]|uniref:Zinc-dependent alcohol dehydrogenase family protein n=1 Tax=Streptomyces boetiae TaxID=3075541 RepID=A0ABU2L4K1_9ACTN|nr:zinc-dependent alcohol dehydrogenase family protein [Streptomyces sp. DSM 44917]MDT0306485.1 zinc-dependent alcohol dehydrogenase family protein [Streptomyces sp. DSM 44917]
MSKAVLFHETGGPEVLRVEDVELPEPGPGELRIRVEAFGLNRAEGMLRSGTYVYRCALPARLGYEAAGVVEAVGPSVAGFAVGDPVSTVSGFAMGRYGVYGTHANVPAAAVLHRAPDVDAVTGAAAWVAHTTAYGALVEGGGMRPGDHVVIAAATGSVGLAAIQQANRLGAIPIATTRTKAKRAALEEEGAAHVIVTDEEDLAEEVAAITGGRGAELVLDPVGGPFTPRAALAVAPGGTLIVYGAQSGEPTPLPPNWPLTVTTYTNDRFLADPGRFRRARHFIDAGLRDGAFLPRVDRVYEGLEHTVEAHRRMESNAHVGKLVVRVSS